MSTSDHPAKKGDEIRCRVAACPEALGDGKEWSFYLLNDSNVPFDEVVLRTFGQECGDTGNTTSPNVKVTNVVSGDSVLIWRDNGEVINVDGVSARLRHGYRYVAAGVH